MSHEADSDDPGQHVGSDLSSDDLAVMARHGGPLDWLDDEPDLYSDQDGEPI
jgi:hypothetical protein